MKHLLSYIIPQKIAEFATPFNTYIRINDEGDKRKLLVNGSPQSGKYIDVLWHAAFCAFTIASQKNVKNVLVLGVAGGTVIHKVHALFPHASIIGVEIDPVMIDIGKKYFDLETISSLHLVHADAKIFVSKEVTKKHRYDLVIVDMSFGRIIPEFLSTPQFIKKLQALMSKNGCVVINYLRELEYQKKSDAFMKTVQEYFPVVRDHVIYRNRFFFCSYSIIGEC